MKQASLTIALTALFLTNQSFVNPSVKETVRLDAGTPVSFKLCENKNSDELEIGNQLLIITDDIVVAEGQIVIKKGIKASAIVDKIRRENQCRNCADKRQSIEISVDNVKAVDGQDVSLFGATFTVRSKCPKCPVELNTSMHLTANVQSNTLITTR